MKLKDYLKEFIKSMQEIEVTYNRKYNDVDETHVETKLVRTGLYGKILNEYILSEIENREVYCVSTHENSLCIFLKDKDYEIYEQIIVPSEGVLGELIKIKGIYYIFDGTAWIMQPEEYVPPKE
jgi:hypothetical protein